MLKLQGRSVIVTGGGSGIGRAICALFGAEGARVVVADINEAGATETATLVKAVGGAALAVRCDVAKLPDVQRLVESTIEAYGRLDVLVNNAAYSKPYPPVSESVADMPEDHWRATLEVNLSGYFHCAKLALGEMLKQGSGVILNVSSVAGIMSGGGSAAYASSKAAIITLTKSMAADYGPRGIRVNAVCPGPISTPRTAIPRSAGEDGATRARRLGETVPLRRIGTPDDVARLALFLVSDDASFITGAVVPVDGGRSLGGARSIP